MKVLMILSVMIVSTRCFATLDPPVIDSPPAPVMTCSKNVAVNSVDCTWTASAGPYAFSRSQNPNYNVGPVIALSGGIAGLSASDVALTDGNNYYYKASDTYDYGGPKLYKLTPNIAVPGTVISGEGIHINTVLGDNKIFLNDVQISLSSATATTFSFTLPAGVTSGYVMLDNSYGSSDPVPFTVLENATNLSNISSLAVDSARVVFVSDIGTAPTSDMVYKIDSGTYTFTQIGALGDPIGMAVDSSDFVYYGNGTNAANNQGVIEKTNSSGAETYYSTTGCAVPLDEAWIFGIGIDQDAPGLPVYVWDGLKKKIRRVPPNTSCNSVDKIGPFTGIVARPQGAVVNNNFTSPRTSNLTISKTPAPRIEEYEMGTVTSVDFWTSPTVPMTRPAQMAITPIDVAERLIFADQTGNRVVMLNQSTDKSLALDWNVNTPRAIAVDKVSSTRADALVGENTQIKRFPLSFNVVYVQIWLETASGATQDDVMIWFNRAKAYFLKCRLNVVLRGITEFADAVVRDLDSSVGNLPPPGNPYNPTAEEQSLLSMRSSEPHDLNIYVVRNFINPVTQFPILAKVAYTLTEDYFTDIVDSTNSGIFLSVSNIKAPSVRGQDFITLAHEMGHALLCRHALLCSNPWPTGVEHFKPSGSEWEVTNLMHRNADPHASGLDSAQCDNFRQNIEDIFFRGDP